MSKPKQPKLFEKIERIAKGNCPHCPEREVPLYDMLVNDRGSVYTGCFMCCTNYQ